VEHDKSAGLPVRRKQAISDSPIHNWTVFKHSF